jgi:hypothetical protein
MAISDDMEFAAEMLWQSESVVIDGKESVKWNDVAEEDKEKYRVRITYVLTKLRNRVRAQQKALTK